jgi:hypothetical protein
MDKIKNACFEAREATRAYFRISNAANAASRIVEHMRSEARETTRSDFRIAPSTDTAAVANAIQVAAHAERAKLLVALLADSATVVEAIQEASEATRTNFLVAPATGPASRRILEVVKHLRFGTSEATCSDFGVTPLAVIATAVGTIQTASQTKRADLLVALVTDTTRRRVPQVVNQVVSVTREAARSNLAIAPTTNTTPGQKTVGIASDAEGTPLLISTLTAGATV